MFETLAHLIWRGYPATGLMLFGACLTASAWRRCRTAWPRPLVDTMQPLLWLRGFRLAIVGLAVIGTGAAWLWQIAWLLVLSLVVVAEETLECSIAIAALRSEQRLVRPQTAAPANLRVEAAPERPERR